MKNEAMRQEAIKIMEALAGVDEELLARCEAGKQAGEGRKGWNKKKNLYLWRLSSCAALLCVFVVGALSWRELGKLSREGGVDMSMSEVDGATGGMPGSVPAGAVSPTAAAVYPEALPPAGAAYGNFGAGDGGKAGSGMSDMNAETSMEAKSEGVQPGSYEEFMADNRQVGDGIKKTTSKESLMAQQESDKAETDGQGKILSDEACIAAPREKLTEAEARQIEPFSSYIPSKLPAGYVFEEASCDPERNWVRLCWCRGMDSIRMGFETVDGDKPETVDIAKPESYDERLYEIPYLDKIPKEYWYTFQSPVFAKEDLSLEIVRSRVLSYSGDTGDTSTPRGNFSVLCDGVLISFNGRGTPEQIWEMFSSILE